MITALCRIRKDLIVMTLANLQKDMIAAMKSQDKVRKGVISSLIAAVKNTE